MTTRTVRTLAAAAASAALILGLAGPAMAAQTVTTLPAKVKVAANEQVTVTIDTPAGFTCAQAASPGAVGWSTKVVGQRAGVASVSAVNCDTAGRSTWTVTAANLAVKKNAVVKFIAVRSTDPTATDARSVLTLVVKLNPGAKPGKPEKPSKPSGQGNGPKS